MVSVYGRPCGHARLFGGKKRFGNPAFTGVSRGLTGWIRNRWIGRIVSQSRRATNCATPRYEIVNLPGRFLPKQARYQLRYTRLWNCVICGLLCGLGRFLTNGFAEMVPASGSVPAGCGIGPFPSWMGGICSQTKRAPNLYYTQLFEEKLCYRIHTAKLHAPISMRDIGEV